MSANETGNDPLIWKAFAAGDREAYARLYRVWHPRLFNYGHRFTEDTATVEDCIQDLFVQLFLQPSGLSAADAPQAYLLVCFRRQLLRKLKEGARFSVLPEEVPFALEASIEQVLIGRERLFQRTLQLDRAVARLTARQREAVFLLYFEKLSYPALAEVLGLTLKGAYKLIGRAVAELREEMDSQQSTVDGRR